MASTTLVFPGETVSQDILPIPSNPNLPLKLGPGLRHTPPSTITTTLAGSLRIDQKRNAIWVEHNSGRYIPQPNDLVIATIHHSSTDYYMCALTPHMAFALLPQLAFEGATKKTRPQLTHGSLVYARVITASKYTEPEIACYNPSTGKSEGMGELKGGMLFDVSLGLARRLLMKEQWEEGGVALLELLGEKVGFEVAVGRNGRVWVRAESVRETLVVGRALREVDEGGLGVEGQERLVRRLVREL